MTAEDYLIIQHKVIEAGYEDDILWQRGVQPCDNAYTFLMETVWVILNSGMKEQIARQIWERIRTAWSNGEETWTAFGHKGKVKAIDFVRTNYPELFKSYIEAPDKIAFLQTIPFIGGITKFHLAKNLGHDCCKPDRHLIRIADHYKTSPELLCKNLSEQTGERIATIDIVLWRAANLGIINTQMMLTQ